MHHFHHSIQFDFYFLPVFLILAADKLLMLELDPSLRSWKLEVGTWKSEREISSQATVDKFSLAGIDAMQS